MICKSDVAKSDRTRCIMAVMMSIVFVAASGALAKNHDAQRITRQGSEHARHDRAAGPLEASNGFDRVPD